MEIAGLSPSYLNLFLRCFVVDLDDENEDTFRADEAAIRQLPSELRSSHCLPSTTASSSDPLSNSEHFCKTHSQISPELVISLYNSLKTLIFHPPAAIGPTVHRNAHSMVIAGMESVMDSNYDEMFGWQNDSVFEKCTGCRCTRLLSEEMFIYTLFIFLSCSDKVVENLESILTHVYLIWPEVVEGYTEYTARFCIECAQREGCSLRKEIEQLGIELQYITEDEILAI